MRAADFGEFLEAVHGYRPFPWQEALAERVIDGVGWPGSIAAPTAAGKTAVIDLAVFALAASIEGSTERAPRRIFFVIDRRVVVDAAFERARTLEEALADPKVPIVREVAERLASLGGETPLMAAVLRGGIPLDRSWARSPLQPVVCVSTVDQVGSRLLFRGYGLSRDTTNLLPIDAALVGNDALIILDEAHLSEPFSETLDAIRVYREAGNAAIGGPWLFVRMTATPGKDAEEPFTVTSADLEHPSLGPRLSARKPTRLVEVGAKIPAKIRDSAPAEARRIAVENRAVLVRTLCEQARSILDEDPTARVVAVVVNRVATAREVHRVLSAGAEAILLTGRARPWDRDRLVERYRDRIFAGRTRDPEAPPLFVVATQAIEVGADLDFDGLVTECASLDALRQRFGRLDRLGERGTSRGAIVARADQTGKGAEDDRIYGPALAETWRWLKALAKSAGGRRRASIDMGVPAFPSPAGDELLPLLPPLRHAPVMLPAHLDLFVQTSPVPRPDPDVGVFLHGPATEPPDVTMLWRADLDPEDAERWAGIVSLAPPVAAEGLPVPVYAARAWLARLPEADVADVEGEQADGRDVRSDCLALRWRGARSAVTGPISPLEISPGDVLVVPAVYGGADVYGWDPSSAEPVTDVGDQARTRSRKRVNLRLHPDVIVPAIADLDDGLRAEVRGGLRRLAQSLREGERAEALKAEEDCLRSLASIGGERWLVRAATVLLDDAARRRTPYPDLSGVAIEGSRRVEPGPTLTVLTDTDDASSFLGVQVPLEEHCSGVGEWTRRYAQGCGLGTVSEDLVRAANLHDLGKADPRFQVMLHGGDESGALTAHRPLAKSGMDTRNRGASQAAFRASGLPRGYRHEATSLALVEQEPGLLDGASDPDLVRHLIASHHGAARPFLPPVADDAVKIAVRWEGFDLAASTQHGLWHVASGVGERFWSLVRRYGWYGLAYLEAILRLADHRRSEHEAQAGGAP